MAFDWFIHIQQSHSKIWNWYENVFLSTCLQRHKFLCERKKKDDSKNCTEQYGLDALCEISMKGLFITFKRAKECAFGARKSLAVEQHTTVKLKNSVWLPLTSDVPCHSPNDSWDWLQPLPMRPYTGLSRYRKWLMDGCIDWTGFIVRLTWTGFELNGLLLFWVLLLLCLLGSFCCKMGRYKSI